MARLVVASAVALALPLAIGPVPAAVADTQAGKRLFLTTCATCHGRGGERRALGQSKPLRTLDTATVVETLRARRDLPVFRTMQDRIKAGLSEPEIDALAAYVTTFQSP